MRIKATLVALSLLTIAASGARGRSVPPRRSRASGPPARVATAGCKWAPRFLPMAMGKFKFSDTFDTTTTQEAYLGYGVGLSASYEVVRGLFSGSPRS